MVSSHNDSQCTHFEVLVSSKVLEELSQYLFAEFSLLYKERWDVNGESESPFWKLQKVLTVALQMSI